MGTVSDKLTYLNGTKTALKDSINLMGVNITDDTFRSYADKIKDGLLDIMNNGTEEVWNNWEKVSASDVAEATLNNTVQAPMEIGVEGRTTQKQLTGKNLLNINGTVYTRNNQSTVSISGNEITVTSNYTSASGYVWWNIPVTPNQDYTISYGNMIEGVENQNNHICYTFSSEPITEYTTDMASYSRVNKTNKVATVTPTENYLVLVIRMTAQTTNVISNLQVEQGTTATAWEQYCGRTSKPKSRISTAY